MGMAISPDGRRLYASGWTGMETGYTLKVIDAIGGAVIATIPVGRFAVDVEVTPDGSVVYVTHLTTGTGHLSVINAATNALATTISVGVNPYSLAITPDGNRVLVPANGVPFSVAVVNRHTNTVTGSIPGPVHMRAIDITSDGARAIVAAEEGVATFDIVANTLLDTIAFDTVAEGSPKAVTVLPTPPQAPTDLIASSIQGNVVSLRWQAPVSGTPPTGYLLEGGISPGQTLAAIPTASQLPTFTFTAPSGVFYVRVRALAGGVRSAPSNEIRISVNPPMAPSAPEGLVGLVNGSSLALAWRNTFAGGATSAIVLEVTGSITTSLTLGTSESFSFGGVPAGTYTLAVRATNPFGTSALSNAVTVTFPGACSGVPLPPENFTAVKAGSTIQVSWDPAATGPAPTGFVLHVSGAFTGSIPTTGRSLTGAVQPGTYNLRVAGTNPCGEGEATTVQVVTVP
jgi:YVTN family beta-propeller protein